MHIIVNNIKWIMIVTGLITGSMIATTITPNVVLNSMFGESLNHPVGLLVSRSWGVLVFLIGVLLVIGGIKPVYRRLALVFASVSKLAFSSLIMLFGADYLNKVFSTLVLDLILVAVFVLYLYATRGRSEEAEN